MPLNPCGYAVAMLRTAYKTRMRPFADNDSEVEIRWYRCNDDAPTLPFPTVYTSNLWNRQPWRKESPGEVWGAGTEVQRPNRIPGVPNGHICGTPEEFAGELFFDPDRPPTVYDADGLPVCCREGGGLLIGGEAPSFSDTGGVELAGEVEVIPEPSNTCPDAPLFPMATEIAGNIPDGVVQYWYRWAVVNDGQHYARFVLAPPAGTNARIWVGDSCDFLAFRGNISFAIPCEDFNTDGFDFIYLDVLSVPGVPGPYILEVGEGPC